MEGYLDAEEAKINYEQDGNRIPAFLKVLCILTFVGAGFGILGGFYAVFANDWTIKTLEMSQDNPFSIGIDYSAYIEKLRAWGVVAGLLNVLGNGLSLLGALMMWKLRKTGYYIYVVGHIIPLVALYALLGGGPGMGAWQGFQVLTQAMGIIFPIAFIIMYGVNLKHMK